MKPDCGPKREVGMDSGAVPAAPRPDRTAYIKLLEMNLRDAQKLLQSKDQRIADLTQDRDRWKLNAEDEHLLVMQKEGAALVWRQRYREITDRLGRDSAEPGR